MHDSEHNRKVAISRWSKVLAKEKATIPQTADALRKKAALCGFLAGDGSVLAIPCGKAFQYRVGFFADDALMLSTYCEFMKSLYGKTPRVRKGNGACLEALATSRTIYEDVCSVATFGIKRWKPCWVLFSTPGAREVWLRAFFSAEAYVGPHHIKIQTVNEPGMRDVSKLLDGLDIQHRCYKYSPKNHKHSIVHMIFISQKAARKSFAEKIGFWHHKKTEALKESLDL